MAKYKINGIEFDELITDRSLTKTPCLYYRDGGKCVPIMFFKKAGGIPDAFYETILRNMHVKIKVE